MKSKSSGGKRARKPAGAQPSEEEQAKANGFLVVGISPSSCIMRSGHLDATYVQAALGAGANAYVGKGNIQALGKALQEVLSGNSQEDDSAAKRS
jgi:DNA-binding NarL/FixJ family response regulator